MVVGANIANAAEPVIEHADAPKVLLVQEVNDGVFPFIGIATQRESYAPSGVKLPPSHDMATQAPALHIGVAESVQSADAGNGIDGASCQRDCEGHHGRFHSWSRGHARPAVLPARDWICQIHAHFMPRSKGRHNTEMVCDPLPSWMKNRGGGTPLGNTTTQTRSTLKVLSPYRYNSHF